MTKTDDFNRADSFITLGANWTSVGTWGIFANEAYSPGSGSVTYWSADVFDGDHSSQVVGGTFFATDIIGPAIRVQPGGDCYVLYDGHLYKSISGSATDLGNTGASYVSGDIMKVSAVGTTIKVYKNGAEVFSVTDTSLSGGAPGISTNSLSVTVDNWVGEDATGGGGGGTTGWQNILLLGVG